MNEREIFDNALGLVDPAERAEYLENACGEDHRQRAHIEGLLKFHSKLGGFLESPPVATAEPTIEQASQSPLGAQIGPYKLREQLGEGGMGVVYVAEQTEPVKRKVALKVIKPGMASKDVVARFEAERQALGMMDHPNIAKVHDGGTTDSGQPYFIMELVCGLSLAQYCDEHALSTDERLQIFLKVCRAVQHAHQKGIIHRDLKPSNVLVASIDDQAVPKVIDFGVAKAAGPTLTEKTVYTQISQLVGTPLYMSPEQVELGVADVDTRSDVYSLGVLLYELLTGNTPFDSDTLKSAGFDEMRRIIRDDEPPKPSAMVSTLKVEALSTIAHRRRSDPRKLCESLSGELDWLVMQAMEKDRDRRYQSAGELADDIERYLGGAPIAAVPPSITYRFRKYAQRNKALLTTVTLVLCSVIVGLCATLLYARKAMLATRDVQAALQVSEARARETEAARSWSNKLLYAADMKLTSDAIAAHDMRRAVELLTRHLPGPREPDLRGFEWHYYHKLANARTKVSLDLGAPVNAVACSPNNRWLAAATSTVIRIYDTENWQLHQTIEGEAEFNGIVWSQDGEQLAAAVSDGSVRVWDLSANTLPLMISSHAGEAYSVVFAPDGHTLYSSGNDNLAIAWDLESGEKRAEFQGHKRGIEAIAISVDGSRLATASDDKTSCVFDADTARLELRINHNDDPSLVLSRMVAVAFCHDGNLVAVADIEGHIFLANCNTGESKLLTRHTHGVEALTFLPGDEWLVTADRGGTVRLHPIPASLEQIESFRGQRGPQWIAHEGRITSLALAGEGRTIVSAGVDGTVRAWQIDLDDSTWQLECPQKNVGMACGLPGRLYISGNQIDVWDMDERRLIDSFAKVETPWQRIACSGDGGYLVAGRQGELALFELNTQSAVRKWPLDSTVDVHRVAISAAGDSIAMANFTDRTKITVFHRVGLHQPRQLPIRQCYCLSFSPDGALLAAGHTDDVRVFNLNADDEYFDLRGHTSTVSGVDFSPDGTLMATVSHDRQLGIWDVRSRKLKHQIAAHRHRIGSAAFSPDGKSVATASAAGVVKLWHVATGQPLGEIIAEHGPRQPYGSMMQFDAGGMRLISNKATKNKNYVPVIYDASNHGGTAMLSVASSSTSSGTPNPRGR